MKSWFYVSAWVALIIFDLGNAAAQDVAIPESLQPWKEWVLRDSPYHGCIPLPGMTVASSDGDALCEWPSELSLRIEEGGASFEQQWFVERKRFVSLPGGGEHEAFDVEVDGTPALLARDGEVIRVELERGAHRVSGRFRWSRMPEWLQADPHTGSAIVRYGGERVSSPKRDEDGRIWIQAGGTQASSGRDGGNREGASGSGSLGSVPSETGMGITVFRKISDGVPLIIETLIELRVGGTAREERIASPQLPGLQPMFLESAIPAALDQKDGMRVRVLPGIWQIRFKSQAGRAPSSIQIPTHSLPWADREIWVFEADPELRQIELQGLPSIDPTQTRLPEEWKKFTAYEGVASQVLKFEELRRGSDDTVLDATEVIS